MEYNWISIVSSAVLGWGKKADFGKFCMEVRIGGKTMRMR
jgi:hypothetical protein